MNSFDREVAADVGTARRGNLPPPPPPHAAPTLDWRFFRRGGGGGPQILATTSISQWQLERLQGVLVSLLYCGLAFRHGVPTANERSSRSHNC